MNALSPDLRAFVQQGVLTLPQAAGMMHAVQPPDDSNAAAADGHEETKGGEEDRGQPPPPPAPKPIKVTRALLVAFAREHLLRTHQFLSFLAMMPAGDPLHTALLTALSETKLPLSNYVLCGNSACADPSSFSSKDETEATARVLPPLLVWIIAWVDHGCNSMARKNICRSIYKLRNSLFSLLSSLYYHLSAQDACLDRKSRTIPIDALTHLPVYSLLQHFQKQKRGGDLASHLHAEIITTGITSGRNREEVLVA